MQRRDIARSGGFRTGQIGRIRNARGVGSAMFGIFGQGEAVQVERASAGILVVDDDADCLAEYGETIAGLGYPVECTDNATTALRLVAERPEIGIIVTDLKMPGMDGLTLLEELSSRFMRVRPLVAIVVTGSTSVESAIQAMRSNAMGFLPKPVTHETISTALRRASARLAQIDSQFRLLALSTLNVNAEKSRDKAPAASRDRLPTESELLSHSQSLLKNRQNRVKYFDPNLVAGPAWDILLDLAVASLKGEAVAVSSACAATQAPLSTALRYVNHLIEAGLVRRYGDSLDRRRSLLELEPHAFDAMTRYLSASWSAFQKP